MHTVSELANIFKPNPIISNSLNRASFAQPSLLNYSLLRRTKRRNWSDSTISDSKKLDKEMPKTRQRDKRQCNCGSLT